MDKVEKIRQEIERQMNFYDGKEREVLDDPKQFTYALFYQGHQKMCAKLLSFLDTLSEEPDRPEPYTGKYDEAYLNDCIARAKKSWEGVDVDKYMDMVRGKEPDSEELVEEVKRYYSDNYSYITSDQPTLSIVTNIARHFAEWGAEHLKK